MSGGGDQLYVPAVLPLPLLEESISLPANGVVLEEAQPLPCLSEQEITNPGVGPVFRGTDPFLCILGDFLEEEYKVEGINAYY